MSAPDISARSGGGGGFVVPPQSCGHGLLELDPRTFDMKLRITDGVSAAVVYVHSVVLCQSPLLSRVILDTPVRESGFMQLRVQPGCVMAMLEVLQFLYLKQPAFSADPDAVRRLLSWLEMPLAHYTFRQYMDTRCEAALPSDMLSRLHDAQGVCGAQVGSLGPWHERLCLVYPVGFSVSAFATDRAAEDARPPHAPAGVEFLGAPAFLTEKFMRTRLSAGHPSFAARSERGVQQVRAAGDAEPDRAEPRVAASSAASTLPPQMPAPSGTPPRAVRQAADFMRVTLDSPRSSEAREPLDGAASSTRPRVVAAVAVAEGAATSPMVVVSDDDDDDEEEEDEDRANDNEDDGDDEDDDGDERDVGGRVRPSPAHCTKKSGDGAQRSSGSRGPPVYLAARAMPRITRASGFEERPRPSRRDVRKPARYSP